MGAITYTDKVSLATPSGLEVNQWRDNNANEVKTQVNDNDTRLTSLETFVGFQAKNSTTSISSTTFTKVSFSVEINDPDSAWDGSRYTVPTGKGGKFLVTGLASFASMPDGSKGISALYLNGVLHLLFSRGVQGGTDIAGYGGALLVDLVPTDYIEMYVFQNSGTSVSMYATSGYNHFSAIRIT